MNPLRVVMVIVGLVLSFAAVVVVWFSMREIMNVGGTCAEGGPFVIAQECPSGVNDLLVPAIFAGIAGFIICALGMRDLPGPELVRLLWPALFISLGYNFLEPVFNRAPGESLGDVSLPLMLGAFFIIMGIAPLIYWLVKPGMARKVFWAHETLAQEEASAEKQHNEDIAMLMLKQDQAQGEVTPERLAAIQDVLNRGAAPDQATAASQPQASPGMFIVQVVSIVAGVILGIWISSIAAG